jgi:SAM-dependent methyltransferase
MTTSLMWCPGLKLSTESDRLDSIRIAFLPAGTMDTASSRLRCYTLAQELANLGFTVQLGMVPEQIVDVLFVQKRINAEVLELAKAVKWRGGLVIYDIDDYGDALAGLKVESKVHSEFIDQCDVISVDTDVRHDVFAADPLYARIPNRWVIPDPIDYVGGTFGTGHNTPVRQGGLIGCWFGNAPNIVPAIPYLEVARQCSAVARMDVISNKEFLGKLGEMLPDYRIEAWALNTFPQRLRESDFCLLIHDTGVEGVQKSNNKMLAALALGVVPFVSRTPAYESAARAMCLEDLLLDTPEDLSGKLTKKKIRALKAVIAAEPCQRELSKFQPAHVAKGFAEKLGELFSRRSSNNPAKRLTIVTHHYNNHEGVKLQLDTWRSYPKEILEQLDLIVVDDFSDSPAKHDFTGLPLRRFRVETDIEWNQCGCRNLGASQARTDWLLLYDIDHIIDRDNISRLLSGLGSLDPKCLYQFGRLENDVAIYSAPNCFLVDRLAFLDSGGYDEDFCGHYGLEDIYFLHCWQRRGNAIVQLTNVELRVDGVGTARLDRDLTRNRQLMEQKLRAEYMETGPRTRFSWQELETHSGVPCAESAPVAIIRLNLGSGEQPLPGYINVDLAPERRGQQPDVNCDVRDLRGVFSDGYADEILAVHVVEHMWRWEVVDILKEWVRVLKPGGDLILECPNLISACEALLQDPVAGAMPDQRGNRTMWCFYGDPSWKDPLMCHRWLYTPQSLADVMHEAGLRDLRQEPALFKARAPRDMRIVGTKPIGSANSSLLTVTGVSDSASPPFVLYHHNNLLVVESEENGASIRNLWVGPEFKFRQSAYIPADPKKLVLPYTQHLMASLLLSASPRSALVLGVGGAAVPRALKEMFSEKITVDLVDINKDVFSVAHEFFGLDDLGAYGLFEHDAENFVRRIRKTYDLIIVDIWNDVGVPDWLLSDEFLDNISRILAQDGVVALNAPMIHAEQLGRLLMRRFSCCFLLRGSNAAFFCSNNSSLNAAAIDRNTSDLRTSLTAMGVDVDAIRGSWGKLE